MYVNKASDRAHREPYKANDKVEMTQNKNWTAREKDINAVGNEIKWIGL